MKKPALGILEFGYTNPPELYSHQVINSMFEEVSQFNQLGYKRLWLSEHYSPEFAWYNPEMLLPLLAGYSDDIRIGWSGVLLSYHSPLTVAHNFKILSAIYPDRIDLGIARAGIPDHTNIYLIAEEERKRLNENWDNKLTQLFSFLRNDDPEKGLLKMVLPPHGTSLPEQWMLGVSPNSAATAVRHQCNFCVSFMHPGSDFEKNRDILKKFRDDYQELHGTAPVTAVLLPCVATSDEEKIARFEDQYFNCKDANVFGSANYVYDKLDWLARLLDCDEMILFNPEWNRELRMESYAEIAAWTGKKEPKTTAERVGI